eukprot:COSAG02_NODE_596_length_19794_cov_14.707591_8_plen_156_part_00
MCVCLATEGTPQEKFWRTPAERPTEEERRPPTERSAEEISWRPPAKGSAKGSAEERYESRGCGRYGKRAAQKRSTEKGPWRPPTDEEEMRPSARVVCPMEVFDSAIFRTFGRCLPLLSPSSPPPAQISPPICEPHATTAVPHPALRPRRGVPRRD